MSPRSDLVHAITRRDLDAVITHLADRFAIPADVACPTCGGCLPGDGPDELVCQCGTHWEGVAS